MIRSVWIRRVLIWVLISMMTPDMDGCRALGQTAGDSRPALPAAQALPSGLRSSGSGQTGRVIEVISVDPNPEAFTAASIPRTTAIAADATLHDICCVGSACWAVGDRGVIARSDNAGLTWTTSMLPFECTLRSVCFLTNKLGWVAGVRSDTSGDGGCRGVLLNTRDGGHSWQTLIEESGVSEKARSVGVSATAVSAQEIPGFLKVAYFGLEEGLAVTLPVRRAGSATLFRTEDGGRSWMPVPGDTAAARYTTGAFLSASDGIVGGEHQVYGTLVADEVVTVGRPMPALRQIRGVCALPSGEAWIVGDGAVVLASSNAGVTWKTVDPAAGQRLDQMVDLRSVTQRGNLVMIAGAPGSVVFRSADGGQQWQARPTGAIGEIRRLAIADERVVLAIGSLGCILRSEDAGMSWQAVRSEGYRAGLLTLVTEVQDAAWELTAAVAGEEGVRTVTAQLSPELPVAAAADGNDGAGGTQSMLAAEQALAQLGAGPITREWMFPRNRPEHHLSLRQLVSEWNRQTDGDLRRLLPLRLARLIRMWRPTAIVVESLDGDDAVARLTSEVLPEALRLAGGQSPESAVELQRVFLTPWTVARVVVRCPVDRTTALAFRPGDLLPACATTSGILLTNVLKPLGLSSLSPTAGPVRICYEILPGGSDAATPPELFAGLQSQLNTEARRSLDNRPAEDAERLRQIAKAAEIESSAFQGQLRMGGNGAALMAELQQLGSQLPPSLALQQLRELAELNRQSDNIDGYISVLQEILRRFPESADGQSSAQTLMLYYGSAEVRRYRLDQMLQATHQRPATRRVTPLGIPEAEGGADSSSVNPSLPQVGSIPGVPSGLPSGLPPNVRMSPSVEQAGAVGVGRAGTEFTETLLKKWDVQAETAWSLLQSRTPDDISTVVLMRQAASLRNAGRQGEHSALLSQISTRHDGLSLFAAAEAQVAHGAATPAVPVVNLRKAVTRPRLDALLNDSCWEEADEIFLQSDATSSGAAATRSLLMMSWDDEFLYLAARLEHLDNAPAPEPIALNRDHDAAHGQRDRLELHLDVDRDYSTAFRFTVDCTGRTSESCFLLNDWNPDWYAAVESDATTWRCELAIPLHNLNLTPTRAGDLWSIRMHRVVPGYLRQNFQSQRHNDADAAAVVPMAPECEGRGFIRFIRTQKKSGPARS